MSLDSFSRYLTLPKIKQVKYDLDGSLKFCKVGTPLWHTILESDRYLNTICRFKGFEITVEHWIEELRQDRSILNKKQLRLARLKFKLFVLKHSKIS